MADEVKECPSSPTGRHQWQIMKMIVDKGKRTGMIVRCPHCGATEWQP